MLSLIRDELAHYFLSAVLSLTDKLLPEKYRLWIRFRQLTWQHDPSCKGAFSLLWWWNFILRRHCNYVTSWRETSIHHYQVGVLLFASKWRHKVSMLWYFQMCLWKLSEALSDLILTQCQACLQPLWLTTKAVLCMWLLGHAHKSFSTKMDCSGSAVLPSFMWAAKCRKLKSGHVFTCIIKCMPAGTTGFWLKKSWQNLRPVDVTTV